MEVDNVEMEEGEIRSETQKIDGDSPKNQTHRRALGFWRRLLGHRTREIWSHGEATMVMETMTVVDVTTPRNLETLIPNSLIQNTGHVTTTACAQPPITPTSNTIESFNGFHPTSND